ncbi:BREX system P-loop protein BrxC [Marininema halotolerans]|uniref:BREX system P-loop protein BrxC n=1 Tax=Marininema halotolerans TaxID=1155944 RepID=A0A1I6R3T7_9BACL|nr:BREX system P-loop protein BrxC [Marininema halotolerans]SFS59329.1 hypothetical protein SAMN05444972_10490 [Marininema halotolerans]
MLHDIFTIKELFEKDIERNINGVIQAGSMDEQTRDIELTEYVITEEIEEQMTYFYRNYMKSLEQPHKQIGAWISGFFGSGKSHFLKILSYLLDSKVYAGKKTVDYFLEKTENQTLLAQMKQVAEYDSHTILFNIESKSATSSANNSDLHQKEMIVEAFLKTFNEYLGYASTLWIADIERQIDRGSDFAAFKTAYFELHGTTWEANRNNIKFKRKAFKEALASIGVEEETAEDLLSTANRTFSISSGEFATLMKEHCDKQGPNYRLAFFVDEMGQHIGDDRRLMLNLQTLVEDLGEACAGKVWVVVTSQEKIDAVTKIANQGNDDFSKIQGRFPTRMALTSSNTDEVIRRRLLQKTEPAKDELYSRYEMEEQSLKNLLAFDHNRFHLNSGYRSAEEFASFYPFIPYQIPLLQKIFERVRNQGEAGKHLAHGERSLLSAIQEVALELKDEGTSRLASFSQFYEPIRRFLDSRITYTINRASDRENIADFDIQVLKVLYMIKGISEVDATYENITTLLIDSVDTIKADLKKKVRASLNNLRKEVLIQEHANQTFSFLSDDEQEIQHEVDRTPVSDNDIDEKMGKEFFNSLYPHPRFSYLDAVFEFNREFNDYSKGNSSRDLTLHVSTRDLSEEEAMLKSYGGYLVMRIGDAVVARDLEEGFKRVVQLQNYLNVKRSTQLPEEYKRIIDDLGKQLAEFEKQAKVLLRDACKGAIFYVMGKEYIYRGTVENQIQEAMKKLVDNTFNKKSYITEPVPLKNAVEVVTEWGKKGLPSGTINQGQNNQLAYDDLLRYLEQLQNKVIMYKQLIDTYTHKPYGWTEQDVAGITAALYQTKKIELIRLGTDLTVPEQIASSLLNKREREQVEIRVKVRMSPQDHGDLMDLLQEVFNNYEGIESYQDGARLLERYLREWEGRINAIQIRARQGNPRFPYPEGEKLSALQSEIQALLECKDSKSLVEQSIQAFDDLLDGLELLDRCDPFYQGKGIQLFDEAVQLLQNQEDEIIAFEHDTDVMQTKQQMEQILLQTSPYKSIPSLSTLCARLKQRIQALVSDEGNVVLEEVGQIEHEAEALSLKYANQPDALTLIAEAKEKVEKYRTAIEAASQRSTVATFQEKTRQEYHQLQSQLATVSGEEESISITWSDLIPATGVAIQHTEELEAFLKDLRTRLQSTLQRGKIHLRR